MEQRIGIIDPGGIGCGVAGILTRAGRDVPLCAGGETAAGQLLRRVAQRLAAAADPRWKAAAFGVAR